MDDQFIQLAAARGWTQFDALVAKAASDVQFSHRNFNAQVFDCKESFLRQWEFCT